MSDQGEKIVVLAREILSAGLSETEAAYRPGRKQFGLTTLCLTAVLAAAGGSAATHLYEERDRPLTRYERTELDALVFYTAKLKGIDEADLQREVEQRAGIAAFDTMRAADFAAARRYLQDRAR